MALDTEAKRWNMLAWASPTRTLLFNPDTSGLSAIERATVLELYAGNAWTDEVVEEAATDTPGAGSGRLYSVDEWLELTRGPETEKTAQEAPQARIRDSSAKSSIKFDPEKRIDSEVAALEAIRERLLAQEAATGIAQAEIARIDAELEARQDDALLAVLLLVTLE